MKFKDLFPYKLKTRILVFMLAGGIVPVLLLGTATYYVSRYIGINQLLQINAHNMDTYNINLDVLFSGITDTMRAVLEQSNSSDEHISVTDILKLDLSSENEYLKYYYQTILDIRMKGYFANDYILNVFLSDDKDFQYNTSFSMQTVKRPYMVDVELAKKRGTDWYSAMTKLRGKELFIGHNIFADETAKENTKLVFTVAKLFVNTKDFEKLGYMAINVSRDILEQILPRGEMLKNSAYLLIDSQGGDNPEIVFGSSQEEFSSFIDRSISKNNFQLGMLPSTGSSENVPNDDVIAAKYTKIVESYYKGVSDSSYIIVKQSNAVSNWDILFLLDKKEAYKSSNVIGYFTVIIAIFIAVFSVILCVLLMRSVNKPLERLYKFAIKTKEAEFKALQAQINPHFLYNTLNTIYWLAKIKEVPEIAQITTSLSELFKFYLDRGSDLVTVAEEVRILNNYLSVQKIRYRDKMTFDISIDEDIYDCVILKLILQPILENAIYHGLEPKVGAGSIRLTGKRTGDSLFIVIEDDGVGMDTSVRDFEGFGLKNIAERIALYYGKTGIMDIKSEVGAGTTVSITLPASQA